MGQSPDSSLYNEEQIGMPFYQGNADFGEIHPKARVWCTKPTKVAKSGDILISVRAPIGALNIANEDCCIGRGLAAITADSKKCSKKYLWYALESKKDELISKGTGSTFKAISKNVLFDTEIPYVPLDKQIFIEQTLDKISQLVNSRKKQLDLLSNLVASRFIELFGDPITNPHEFEKVNLSELAEIKIGPFGSLLHKDDYIISWHALINPSHIIDGKVVPDSRLTISDEKYKVLSAYHLHTGDVVMGRRGEMGRCAVIHDEGYLCGTGSLIIRSYGEVTADYIQKIFSFPSYKKYIENMAVGQTMPNLNVPIVSSFQITKPPIDVQQSYLELISQTDKSKYLATLYMKLLKNERMMFCDQL